MPAPSGSEIVLIANVGARDLTLNIATAAEPEFVALDVGEGKSACGMLSCDVPGARTLGAAARSRQSVIEPRLSFPILNPALAYATRDKRTLDRIVLFATDQPSTVPQRQNDTVESAEVIKFLIETRYRESLRPKRGTGVEIVPVGVDVSRFNDASAEIAKRLKEVAGRDKVGFAYVCLKGGIPAMNMALYHFALSSYVNGCFVEVGEPPGGSRGKSLGFEGTPHVVPIWDLRREALIERAASMLERCEFEWTRAILEAEGYIHHEVTALLKHGQARLNLDFTTAAESLEGYEEYEDWKNSSDIAWSTQRLEDVLEGALACWRRNDLVGFVARIETFNEISCRVAIHAATGEYIGDFLTDDQVNRISPTLKAELEGGSADSANRPRKSGEKRKSKNEPRKCNRKKVGPRDNRIEVWSADRCAFFAVFRDLQATRQDIRSHIQRFISALQRLKSLRDFRHQALHRALGASTVTLGTVLGGDPLERLDDIGQATIRQVVQIAVASGRRYPEPQKLAEKIAEKVITKVRDYVPPEV